MSGITLYGVGRDLIIFCILQWRAGAPDLPFLSFSSFLLSLRFFSCFCCMPRRSISSIKTCAWGWESFLEGGGGGRESKSNKCSTSLLLSKREAVNGEMRMGIYMRCDGHYLRCFWQRRKGIENWPAPHLTAFEVLKWPTELSMAEVLPRLMRETYLRT